MNRVDTILNSPQKSEFCQFLESVHCQENFLFWEQVQSYQQLKDPRQLSQQARSILRTYILPQSPLEINIDSASREKIIATLGEPSAPEPSVFNVALKQVKDLMDLDCLPRFLLSTGGHETEPKQNSKKRKQDFDHSKGNPQKRRRVKSKLRTNKKQINSPNSGATKPASKPQTPKVQTVTRRRRARSHTTHERERRPVECSSHTPIRRPPFKRAHEIIQTQRMLKELSPNRKCQPKKCKEAEVIVLEDHQSALESPKQKENSIKSDANPLSVTVYPKK